MIADVFCYFPYQFIQFNGYVGKFFIVFHNSRAVANLSQFHKTLQYGKLRFANALRFYHSQYFISEIVAESLVNFPLLIAHFAEQNHFGFVRQVFGNLLFGTAEYEWEK